MATRFYGINQLLDPEDVNTNKPDKKSILMYVMCLYHAIDSIRTQQMALSADSRADSLHTLPQHNEFQSDQHSTADEDSIQQDDTASNRTLSGDHTKSIDEEFEEIFHAGNLTDLDEISLAKSIEDLSKFTIPTNIKRSSTFTITTKEAGFAALERSDSGGGSAGAGMKPVDSEAASQSFQFLAESRSRPLSTATNASVEISGYQNAIEVVLSLLLEAEEVLSKELPNTGEISEARQQFQDHEDFMVKLSEYQEYVGAALEEGARLLTEPTTTTGLNNDDQSEIKHQMFLLNERWETLRIRALAVQSQVHGRLAGVQLQKIEELRVLLTETEDKISRMDEINARPEVMKAQLDEHKVLEASLNEQKGLVDELSNLVVIVNDDSFNELEDKLAALGERWSHVVKWTKNRFEKLQTTNWKWRLLTERYAVLRRWIDARENDLKTMEQRNVTAIGDVMERMNSLRFCAADLNILCDNLIQLQDVAQELHPATSAFHAKLETVEDRCEALKEIVEVQQQRIEGMGFNFNFADGSSDGVRIPIGWADFQLKLSQTGRKSMISISGQNDELDEIEELESLSKKRRLQKTEQHQVLDNTILEMTYFVEDSEQKLMELSSKSLKEEHSILKGLESELKEKITAYSNVKIMLEACRTAEEALDLTEEEAKITNIGTKYDELNFRLEHLLAVNQSNAIKDKFSRNLTGFKLILADCQDWFKQYANSKSSTINELKNRLEYMDSLNTEISEAMEFCESPESNNLIEWKHDFRQFHQSWSDIKSAINRLIQTDFGTKSITPEVEEDDNNHPISDLEKNVDLLSREVDVVNVHASTPDKMVDNLNKLKSIGNQCTEVQKQIRTMATDVELSQRLEKILNIVNERIIKQTTAIENLNHFTKEYKAVTDFLRETEVKLQMDVFIFGETNDLEARLKEYEAREMEIKKSEIDIISVKNFSEIIVKESSEEDYRQKLHAQIGQLNDQYNGLKKLYGKKLNELKEMIIGTEGIIQSLKDIDTWLTDLETTTPKTQNAEIANAIELFQLKSKFQGLKEKCEQKAIDFRQLNELGSDKLMQIDDQLSQPACQRKYSSLAKQFTRLNARWNDVTTFVYTRAALLEHISGQLGELKTLIVSEAGYLDKLEKCLRKSPENAADAEEIYEELDVSITLRIYWRIDGIVSI